MMREEFIGEVERLKTVYGDKSFPEERVKILWDALKHEKLEAIKRAISNIIGEQFTAPALSKIKAAVNDTRELVRKEEVIETTECSWCGNSGFVQVEHRETHCHEAFKCQCEHGFLKARLRARVWDNAMLAEYITHFRVDSEKPIKMPITQDEEALKELADKYAPSIIASLKGFGKLPYDQKEALATAAEVPF